MTRRRTVPIVLLVLASLAGFAAVLAIWVKRQALETDTWTETSSELLEDPAIRDALADFMVNAIYANVDVEALIAKALPPRAEVLAGPIAGGLRQVATDVARDALEQEKVLNLWENANREAHAKLLALIEDRGTYVATTDGQVSLDLTTLVADISERIGVGGNVAAKLPPGAAQIEIVHSDELAAAQRGVKLLRTLAWGLAILSLLLYALAIYLARDWRREMLRAVGISFIAVGVIDLIARKAGGDAVVDSLSETETADAAVLDAWNIGTSLLEHMAESVIAYGVFIAVAAWLAGPSSVATAIRHAITPYFRQPKYAYLGLAGFLAILFWWDPVVATGRLYPSLLLIALLAIGVEALRRQVIREFPEPVQTGSPEGIARAIADRMHESRDRRIAGRAAPAAEVSGGAAPGPSRVDELERLAKLRDAGVLTDEELTQEKKRILA